MAKATSLAEFIQFDCGFKSSMKSKALCPNVQQTIVKVTDTLSAATEKILIAYEKMDDKGDSQ